MQDHPTADIEIWKTIEDFPDYEISNLGRVRKGSLLLKQQTTIKDYKVVRLYTEKQVKGLKVHRLVAFAFLPNPLNRNQINHIDGDKANNKISNLEFCTGSENVQHAIKLGLMKPPFKSGSLNPRAKLTNQDVQKIRQMLSLKIPHSKIALVFNVCNSAISDIASGKNWSHLP